MKIILIYCSVAILISAMISVLVINSRYQERLAMQGNAVRQLVLAALSYPSGSVMEWPSDIQSLIRFSDGELDKAASSLDMGNLVYPRPDDKGYAIQPAIIYRTKNLVGDRFIVGYCNGDVKTLRDQKIYTVGRTLETRLHKNKVTSLKDWQEFFPEMVRR
jgi:hypothetical protein